MEHKPTMQRWIDCFPKAPLDDVIEVYREVVAHYEEEGREYHGLAHIYYMLRDMHVYFPDAGPELAIAIWLHDVIYDPIMGGNGRNERDSAEYAQGLMLRLRYDREAAERVYDAIVTTYGHWPTSKLAQQLCDLDLRSLSLPAPKYQVNTAKIRREYGVASDEQWRAGRLAFIESFLEGRYAIYSTPRMRIQCEARARRNLAAERASLG
jgi:predicted metal-dependent HD superfamily phosphohydrolase